jgi:eukaryotic-like serine/threonine-protein kinase
MFHQALSRHGAVERSRYLDGACAGNTSLRSQVESMLAAHAAAAADRFGERGAVGALATGAELPSGTTIGSYRIDRLIGVGGMGEVYRARDIRLGREVALKILPTAFASDPDRIERFEREARVLAAMNHPHIAAIHGVIEAESARALVLELVDGDTLQERLSSGELPVDDALAIARQIAGALAAAHEKGIVHRDLKPANISVTPDGTVKVLDFGLATVRGGRSAAAGESQSPTSAATQPGVILGTPPYMSPEQVRGRTLDARTDVWSFGCLLYEMLTGRPAFAADTVSDTMARILEREPDAMPQLRRKTPEIARVLSRCLAKDADARYASGAELRDALDACRTQLSARTRAVKQLLRRPAVRIVIAAIVVAAAALAAILIARAAQVRWARTEAIPRIEQAADAGEWEAAYRQAKAVERLLPDDPDLAELWPRFTWLITIPSDPPGARVYRRAYAARDETWEDLGTTPLERIHLPFGYSVVRFELPGHRPLTRALGFTVEGSQHLMRLDPVTLDTAESLSEGMVRVPGRPSELGALNGPAAFTDFFIGQHEITNREYKRFVDAGGYRRKEFWEHPFLEGGRIISWEDAMALFVDRTGRAGPSVWEAGDYPEERAAYPVGGISWYEASAFARFAGAELPTIHHWRFALDAQGFGSAASWIVPASNLDADGPAPVGHYRGVTWSGAYDMIGNVREWCFNAIGTQRVIAGGGWNNESAFYNPTTIQAALPPLDRSATNGFRIAITHDSSEIASTLRRPLAESTARRAGASPVSDDAFAIYKGLHAYDAAPLNLKAEGRDVTRNWTRERVSLDSSYGERVVVYIYLPRSGTPPYQTLVYYPGEVAAFIDSIDDYRPIHLDFVLKNGRAVVFPIFKGYFERRDRTPLAGPNAVRRRWMQRVNDLRRTLDYIVTRPDVDSTRLAYYGYSTGGYFGPVFLALEPRLRAGVFYLAGLVPSTMAPEVDPLTFLPRASVPVVMFSGDLDSTFPLETSAKPFFRLLGARDKRHVIAPGGHFVERPLLIREMLDWLDRYLGPVGR